MKKCPTCFLIYTDESVHTAEHDARIKEFGLLSGDDSSATAPAPVRTEPAQKSTTTAGAPATRRRSNSKWRDEYETLKNSLLGGGGAKSDKKVATEAARIAESGSPRTRHGWTRQTYGGDDIEVGEALGSGGFAGVHRGKHRPTNRSVAVKVVDKQRMAKERAVREAAERERILLKLDHRFIVRLICVAETTASLLFVMEECVHGELGAQLEKRASSIVRADVVAFYMAEVLQALAYLHAQNVAHRDLKPQNVLLGTDWHARLVDFGCALCPDEGGARRERSSSFVGSVEYMPPEALPSMATGGGSQQNGSSGFAADLWSFGCTCYALLDAKQRSPFGGGGTKYETWNRIRAVQYSFPDGDESFTPAWRTLIDALLQRDERQRLGEGDNDLGDLYLADVFSKYRNGDKEKTPLG